MGLVIFIIGICIGSFVNGVVYRMPRKMNYINDRSRCTVCHHTLKWLDLVPILSFLFLKGKCRYCGSRISIRYLVVELLIGILGVVLYVKYNIVSIYVYMYGLMILFIMIALIDIDTMLIPNELIIIMIIFSFLSLCFNDIGIIERVIGTFIVSLPMYICNYFVESFGGGDIKLISVLGFMVGYNDILILMYYAFLLGGLYAFLFICFKKNEDSHYIPFGPFISIASMLVICCKINYISY